MNFRDRSYLRLVCASGEVDLGDRKKDYSKDLRYLQKFLMETDADFETIRTISHSEEITPSITVKEEGDVPCNYIPAWLKDKTLRQGALKRINRVNFKRRNQALERILHYSRSH
jgi:hypothetical protein